MCVTELLCCTGETGTTLSQLYFSKKIFFNEIKLKVDFKSWYLKKKKKTQIGSWKQGREVEEEYEAFNFYSLEPVGGGAAFWGVYLRSTP